MQKFRIITILFVSFLCLFLLENADVLAQQKRTSVGKKAGTKVVKKSNPNEIVKTVTNKPTGTDARIGFGVGNSTGNKIPNSQPANCKGETADVKIIAKPFPSINNEARQAMQLSGTIRLRVTFLASGELGQIFPINSLPYGLTEDSIQAARKIKFIAAKQCGIAVTKAKVVEYNFRLY